MLSILFVFLSFGSIALAEVNLLNRQVRAAPSATCGQTAAANKVRFTANGTPVTRIVGGVEARPHSIPWQIGLRTKAGDHFCGGSVLRVGGKEESDLILTAAHCFFYKRNGVWVDIKPDQFDVYFGAHYLSKAEPGEKKISPIKAGIVVHEKYDKDANHDDVAIVKLETPVKFTDNIKPVCLPGKADSLPAGTFGIVSGWGDLEHNAKKKNSETLQQVVVPIYDQGECKKAYWHADDGMMCAGYSQGLNDSCQADSGGPLFFKRDNGYVLHGVVSHGFECARANKPGVYARVTYFIDWIEDKIKKLTSVK